MNDICRALISSDVNIAMVKNLRTNVLSSIEGEIGTGANKQRLIQKVFLFLLKIGRC